MKNIAFFVLSLCLTAADQISKWGVSERLLRPQVEGAGSPLDLISWYAVPPAHLPFAQMEVLPFFNLVMVWNKGISFGMFNRDTDFGPIILIIASVLITLIFLVLLYRSRAPVQSLGFALIIGGALGNVIDRLRFGAVIDFLDFHVAGYHWPAFNVADSCICIGVGILIIRTLFIEKSVPAKA